MEVLLWRHDFLNHWLQVFLLLQPFSPPWRLWGWGLKFLSSTHYHLVGFPVAIQEHSAISSLRSLQRQSSKIPRFWGAMRQETMGQSWNHVYIPYYVTVNHCGTIIDHFIVSIVVYLCQNVILLESYNKQPFKLTFSTQKYAFNFAPYLFMA